MDFRVLGRIEVREEGRPIILAPQARRALGILLLHTSTPLSPEDLADLLWGTQAESRTGQTKAVVSEIRRALMADRLPYGREGYRLRLAPDDTFDLSDFRELGELARKAVRRRSDLRLAADLYRQALDLWPGPVLLDVPVTSAMRLVSADLFAERQRLRCEFAEGQIDLGRHESLIPQLRQWTLQDPLDERLWALLLLTLYESGRKDEALQEWGHVRTILLRELCAEPGRALRELAEFINAGGSQLWSALSIYRSLSSDDRSAAGSDTEWIDRAERMFSLGEGQAVTEDSPGTRTPSEKIDTTVSHSARIWDYWLGGKDNYPADRELGDKIAQRLPGIVAQARADRAFLGRVIKFLAGEAGIRQFLDIGTGLPTVDNTHEVAQRVARETRVVYVDNDPLVLAHARALLTSTPEGRTDYLDADLHEPETILEGARATLDFSKPIAITMLGVVWHILDDQEAMSIIDRLINDVPSGSYLVIAHTTTVVTGERMVEAIRQWNQFGKPPGKARTPAQIAAFFHQLQLIEPGVVSCTQWRPEPTRSGEPDPLDRYCAVGRKL
jgi:DNA-binding SARP family transcriptional activator